MSSISDHKSGFNFQLMWSLRLITLIYYVANIIIFYTDLIVYLFLFI